MMMRQSQAHTSIPPKLGVQRCVLSVALMLTVVLAGCSSSEDKVYKAFRCGKVASMVGERDSSAKAMQKVEAESEELLKSYGPNRLQMLMNERFQEDVPLYRYGQRAQAKVLSDLYKKCEKYYQ